MSANLGNAFAKLLSLHSRAVTIERPGAGLGPYAIKITPSNYFRNTSGPEESVIEGREFVITKAALDAHSFIPKRADRIRDAEMGVSTIVEVREIIGFGGGILGYRIRTN